MKTLKIQFGRPVHAKVSKSGVPYGNLVYTSKCGRFTIERVCYQMPSVSVDYRVTDTSTGEVYKNRADTLKEAKELAQGIVDEEHI